MKNDTLFQPIAEIDALIEAFNERSGLLKDF
jgi:hypothetical protein